MAVHDLHCNVSQVSIDAADVILVMRTYPHIDMHERAEEAVSILDKILMVLLNHQWFLDHYQFCGVLQK